MNTSAIRCPGCGAADTSTATSSGVHTCVYCGVRYQISQGTPKTIAAAGAPPAAVNVTRLVIVGAVLAGLTTAAAIYFVNRSEAPSERPRAPSRHRSADPTPILGARPSDVRPAENKSVSVTPTVVDTAPATAEFVLERAKPSVNSALWIYGFFHNTSPFTLGKTKITAVFYDKDGKELGQDSGYTEDDVIAADARVPAVLLVSNPPAAYERLEFEVRPERPSYLPTEVEGLEIEADAPRIDGFLGWKYAGKVHNKSGAAAKFVKVEVLAFDEDDKFAGHAYTYASADALADGDTARFDGSIIDSSTKFTRFEFRVSGRPAE